MIAKKGRGEKGWGERRERKKQKEKEKKEEKEKEKEKKKREKYLSGMFGFSKPDFIPFSIFRDEVSFFFCIF